MNGSIIIWLSLCWIPILFCIMLCNETKFKKNIVIGVTLPYAARNHPDVLARLKQFKQQELVICILMTALCVPGMFLKLEQTFSLWFVWMLASIIAPYVPYVLCNRDLKRIKQAQGWRRPSAADTVTVDLCALPETKWISPWCFLLPAVLSLLPLLWDTVMAVPYLIDAAMVLLCWLGYRYLFRNKAEQVDDNTSVTLALTRIRRCQWGKMWLLCACAMAAMNWLIFLAGDSETMSAIGLVVFTALLLVVSMTIEFRTRALQEKLTADSGKDFYVDDDDKWIGGIVYYNPNDDRLMINDRVGTNSTVNLAKPAGKVIYGALALLLLSMPLWGAALGNGEIETTLTDGALTIKGSMYEYTIEADNVKSVTVLEELPAMARTAGSNLPYLYAGGFSNKTLGKLKVCLDPTAPPFLLVTTEDDLYLIGTRDPALTEAIREELSK